MTDEVLSPLLTVGLLCLLAGFYPLLEFIVSTPSKRGRVNDLPLASESERQAANSAYTTM